MKVPVTFTIKAMIDPELAFSLDYEDHTGEVTRAALHELIDGQVEVTFAKRVKRELSPADEPRQQPLDLELRVVNGDGTTRTIRRNGNGHGKD